MRGEHPSAPPSAPIAMGSSPHARGAPSLNEAVARKLGITPACAGGTSGHAGAGHREEDHPRMRGEHFSRESKQDDDQ